jgi:sortase A
MSVAKWVEGAWVTAGLVLLVVYLGLQIDSYVQSGHAVHELNERALQEAELRPSSDLERDPVTDFTLWSPKRVEEYRFSLLPKAEPPVAVLRVPKLGIEAPVLEGTDDFALNRGVGRIASTSRTIGAGNIGIAGHRDGFFRGLKDVSEGDVIELETVQVDASYVVDDIKIVNPSDTSVLLPRDRPAVTLVTCYPFYFIGSAPERFIVHASLKQVDPAALTVRARKDFRSNENDQEIRK